MMSGHATIDTAVEATRYGALEFLEKPIAMARLLSAVRSGLERGRVMRALRATNVPATAAPAAPATPEAARTVMIFGFFAMHDPSTPWTQNHIFELMVQRTYGAMVNETLLSIPLFVLMGYVMDKQLRREIFLGGQDAENFRRSVQELIEQGPTSDDIDAFLQGFSGLMTQPVVLH